ncbi:uncharacterized protein EV422DRAFT_403683 [Fimicolochytrium jonesii]|uniref:uncharacterized protein n=1 Tax=Fimicolochytrium jonesii TaxID=1396493 RepID=UPI0022FF44BC|nr:uncharacterized protein EV422DRAFT_403683 [Fimicolochytrium jonesii]KAI8822561.1 hypothetical protein EV422DRAFT_403683 [Fimicolochytrium jonesii]
MYSRSERRFMAPDADHANPKLGPGAYTPDDIALYAGKLHGTEGYAPFSSLTPRSSFFDQSVIRGPAPGQYPVELLRPALHSPHKAPEFGMSKVSRFGKVNSTTPGPGTYEGFYDDIALHVAKKVVKMHEPEFGSRTHPLTRQPGRDAKWDTPAKVQKLITDAPADVTLEQAAIAAAHGPEGADLDAEVDGAEPSIHGHLIPTGKKPPTYPVPNKNRKIVWKRKHGAPSIPPPRMAFGFRENSEGDLVPRKPPKEKANSEPAYNSITSFAERARHEHRGPSFAHDSAENGGRLTFKIYDTPAPGLYESSQVQQYFQKAGTGNEAAIMTLAPCVRVTDEILKDCKKKNIPGPGQYEVRSPLTENLARPRGRIRFATTTGHLDPAHFSVTEQTNTPAPGAYHVSDKPTKKRPLVSQSFGATASRFERDDRVRSTPAPGSYSVEEIDSLAQRITKKAQKMRYDAFGSVTERFPQPKLNLNPGPGAYNQTQADALAEQEAHEQVANSTRSRSAGSRPVTRMTRMMDQGPTHFKLGHLLVNPAKAHIPVFGSQTERFTGTQHAELPPPGAYELGKAYEALKKHRVPKLSGMVSGTRREIFQANIEANLPGPGQYEPQVLDKRNVRRGSGKIMTTEKRFKSSGSASSPGPGAYLSPFHNSGLLKKTYNITLTEWAKHHPIGSAPERRRSPVSV